MKKMYWTKTNQVKKIRTREHTWCKCICGKEKYVQTSDLNKFKSTSCGCMRVPKITHGKSKDSIYTIWNSMMNRCYDPKSAIYKHYGQRGIEVCKRWHKFENFYEDMGDRPDGKSLDRINNDKGYYKSNCRWATKVEQMRNTRRNVNFLYKGKNRCIAEIAEMEDVDPSNISRRIRFKNQSIHDAINSIKSSCRRRKSREN